MPRVKKETAEEESGSKVQGVITSPPKRGAPRKEKAATPAEFDELSNLAQSAKQLEDELRAQSGGNSTWVRVLQPGTDITTKGTATYVKGAQAGDFLVPVADGKFSVKETLRVTPLALLKVYVQKHPSGKDSEMDQTVAFWLPDDAEQMPLEDGNNFRRVLGNGDYLMPMHWMYVYMHDFPEVTDAMIPFQSKSNSNFKKIEKMVKANSHICTELILDLKTEPVKNESFNKTYFYPVAEVSGRLYDYDAETGKVSLVKGGASAADVAKVLKLSNEIQAQYKGFKLVAKRDQHLLASQAPAQIAAPHRGLPGATSKANYTVEEDEEKLRF